MGENNFACEYAKSGRASCKGCKGTIEKDSLRIAKLIQSRHFDGKQPHWFHQNCFFPKQVTSALKSGDDIDGFSDLRWNDQQKIVKKIESNKKNDNTQVKLDYAKSSKSTCRYENCLEFIPKHELRISKMVEPDETKAMYVSGLIPAYHHVDCFFKCWDKGKLKLKDFENIGIVKPIDVDILKKKVAAMKDEETPVKRKAKQEDLSPSKKAKLEEEKKEELILNDKLKVQNKLHWNIQDKLKKEVPLSTQREILTYNGRDSKGGEQVIKNRLTDIMAFGIPSDCPECQGQLEPGTKSYKCLGDVSAWTSCTYTTQTPTRKAFRMKRSFLDDHGVSKSCFLRTFKFKKGDKAFPKEVEKDKDESIPTKSLKELKSLMKKEEEAEEVFDETKPLRGYTSAFAGRLKKTATVYGEIMKKFGGKVCASVKSPDCNLLVTSKSEYESQSQKVEDAKDKGVTIVSENFLATLLKHGHETTMTEHVLFSGTKEKSGKSADGKSKKRVKVKGRAEVDPESKLSETAHVYEHKDDIYSVTLGLVDISAGMNSYYKLQLLENDKTKGYHVFRSWGRTGCPEIGKHKIERYGSLDSAKEMFCHLFFDKTGNEWDDRRDFVKHPKKFYLLDIVYADEGHEDSALVPLSSSVNSSLEKPIQNLIRMMFDVKNFNSTLVEFEIDVDEMPLGKLSKKQISEAYSLLSECMNLLGNDEEDIKPNHSKLRDLTNRFYTLIPHDMGREAIKEFDNKDIVTNKTRLLENLQNMEIAAKLISDSKDNKGVSPLDNYYLSLKTTINVLDRESSMAKTIEKYLKQTHGSTHNSYTLDIMDIFTIDRENERAKYEKYEPSDHRQLLWHGSRVTNFAGITSQGLRIAPPEAPVTGYMFGKGIYFADMVSKAANYCNATKKDPYGLLLLSEVKLGEMYELKAAKYIKKLPQNKHSTKGLGRTGPNKRQVLKLDDGVLVPLGKPTTKELTSTLLYNEYIVYNTDQVNIKYMLKVKFNFI